MYTLNAKLWFALYGAAFIVLLGLILSDVPLWVWATWSAAYMLFAVVTDPEPRNARATFSATCGCARCDRMRARHKRRSTDVKDTG